MENTWETPVYNSSERHGSGDPTPCGGYPGTDCWPHFQKSLSMYEPAKADNNIETVYAMVA